MVPDWLFPARCFFIGLIPSNPFFVVNFLCFLVYYYYFYRLGSRFASKLLVVASFFAALLLPYKLLVPHEQVIPLFVQFIFPWNTTPVAAIYAFLMYQSTVGLSNVGFRRLFFSGLLVGYLSYTRPIDIVPLLALAPTLILALLKRRQIFRGIMCLGTGVTISIGLLTALTLWIHGTLFSEYVNHSKSMGFDMFSVPAKFYSVFINSSVLFVFSCCTFFLLYNLRYEVVDKPPVFLGKECATGEAIMLNNAKNRFLLFV